MKKMYSIYKISPSGDKKFVASFVDENEAERFKNTLENHDVGANRYLVWRMG